MLVLTSNVDVSFSHLYHEMRHNRPCYQSPSRILFGGKICTVKVLFDDAGNPFLMPSSLHNKP